MEKNNNLKKYFSKQIILITLSIILLFLSIISEYYLNQKFFDEKLKFLSYFISCLPIFLPVLFQFLKNSIKGNIITEYFLIIILIIGNFYIKEYIEAIIILLFYSIGNIFQYISINKVNNNIKLLLKIEPTLVNVLKNNIYKKICYKKIKIGDILKIKCGEKVNFDGKLINNSNSSFRLNKKKFKNLKSGEYVWIGMTNIYKTVYTKVVNTFNNKLLLYSNSIKEIKNDKLIKHLIKLYTITVFIISIFIYIYFYLLLGIYDFKSFIYNFLLLIVIFCPCSLIISIPLCYFVGINISLKEKILFKNINCLNIISNIDTVFIDKSSFIYYKNKFKIKDFFFKNISKNNFFSLFSALEANYDHPISKTICKWTIENGIDYKNIIVKNIQKTPFLGLRGEINNKNIIIGNKKFFRKLFIKYPKKIDTESGKIMILAINNKYHGHIILYNNINYLLDLIRNIKKIGIKKIFTFYKLKDINIKKPFSIYNFLKNIQKIFFNKKTAFISSNSNKFKLFNNKKNHINIIVNNKINNYNIELSDIIINKNNFLKLITAIKISRATKIIFWQNIIFIFLIKIIMLITGINHISIIWEVVLVDIIASIIIIFNTMRIKSIYKKL